MNTDKLLRSARRTVLVVEDELINRELLGMILQEQYDVIFAENGQVGLDRLHDAPVPISMILLDINMPVMNGYQMMDALKREPDLAKIPIIVLTADHNAEVEALERGAVDFIPKPYDEPQVILARVRRIIEFAEDRQIIQDVERDGLTGLYNRGFFLEYCNRVFGEHQHGELDMIAVDIDRFRLVNEVHGKAFGDTVLKAVAEGIRAYLSRHFGMGCRSEADEFFLLAEHTGDYEEILNSIYAYMGTLNIPSQVHLRLGVYQNVDTAHPMDWFCDAAKSACSNSRGNYAHSITVYDSALTEKELYQQRLISDMDTAIAEKQFKVYFQPKYRIQGKTPVLCSAEALVRWIHPELGFISPGQFIPLFEENGLITKLDSFVWNETAAHIRQWKDKYGVTLPVSVNLSRQDLMDENLMDRLCGIVDDNGIERKDMYLEVTESAYAQDMQHMLETVGALRDAGFSVEMDDFGSGYSSLNMICLMPIDALKIDMKFVQNLMSSENGYHVLELVIDLSHSLKLPAIVEGVEEESEYQMVKKAGCDVVQGYYFSRPLDEATFEKLIVDTLAADKEIAQGAGGPEKVMSYASVARALMQNYFSVYYVNTRTDEYAVYSSHDDFRSLNIQDKGEDFFGETRKAILRFVPEEDQEIALHTFDKASLLRELDRGPYSATYRMRVADRLIYLFAKIHRVEDDHHIIVGMTDVDAQKRRELAYAEALGLARERISQDALTGVKSMHAYAEAEKRWNARIEAGDVEAFAVVICDADGVKRVNESRGRQAGDQYIKDACLLVCHAFQHSPVFRIGGDEFAAILSGSDYQNRMELVKALNDVSAKNRAVDAPSVVCGCADYLAGTDQSLAQVFQRADARMYRAKENR